MPQGEEKICPFEMVWSSSTIWSAVSPFLVTNQALTMQEVNTLSMLVTGLGLDLTVVNALFLRNSEEVNVSRLGRGLNPGSADSDGAGPASRLLQGIRMAGISYDGIVRTFILRLPEKRWHGSMYDVGWFRM